MVPEESSGRGGGKLLAETDQHRRVDEVLKISSTQTKSTPALPGIARENCVHVGDLQVRNASASVSESLCRSGELTSFNQGKASWRTLPLNWQSLPCGPIRYLTALDTPAPED